MLIVLYAYGLVLARRAVHEPMWQPEETDETVVDDPDEGDVSERSMARMWVLFASMAATVGLVGFLVGQAGVTLAQETGLSGSLVGGLFTSVVTSLPELITVITAVRIGATTLAVSDIVGGNTFDVLFIAAGDLWFTRGSIYQSADPGSIFLMATTVVLTALLAAGMISRERRGIGFEGVAILGCYAIAVAGLFII